MDNLWDNLDFRRDVTIKGLLYGSFIFGILGLISYILHKVYPGETKYLILTVIFFAIALILFAATATMITLTGISLYRDRVHNAQIAPVAEMRDLQNESPVFRNRWIREGSPNVHPMSGRQSRISVISWMSSYMRERLLVTGIPLGSDRERGNWSEPDTPGPNSDFQRPEDLSEMNLFEEAFPEEQGRQRGRCVHHRF